MEWNRPLPYSGSADYANSGPPRQQPAITNKKGGGVPKKDLVEKSKAINVTLGRNDQFHICYLCV